MRLTIEFFNNSIFPESYLSLFNEFQETSENDIFSETIEKSIDSTQKALNLFLSLLTSVHENKFQEALLTMMNKHFIGFDKLNQQFASDFETIQNLLTSIQLTSSIMDDYEIKKTQKNWKAKYELEMKNKLNFKHEIKLYREFRELEMMQELINFNSFFKSYLLELIFEIASAYEQRLMYTYRVLFFDPRFKGLNRKIRNIHSSFSVQLKETISTMNLNHF